MLRVRFEPSPTGYVRIGGARGFIFGSIYARRRNGTMILHLGCTDIERNTGASDNFLLRTAA
jgi:glutamyl/glutaminyl-tRNA synthetase